jgi:hypothetical protein
MNPRTQRRRNIQRHRARARHQSLHPHALAPILHSKNLWAVTAPELNTLYDAGCTLDNQMASRSIPVEFAVSIHGWPNAWSLRTQGRRLQRLALKRHKLLLGSFDHMAKIIGRPVVYTRVRRELFNDRAIHNHYRFIVLFFIPRASINAMANPVPFPTFCCNVVDAIDTFLAGSPYGVEMTVAGLRYADTLLPEDALVPESTTLADLGFTEMPQDRPLQDAPA